MKHPEDLSAFQLAAFWSDYLAVRKHVERESEHLVLAGPLSHRRELRHAPRGRFEYWAWRRTLRLRELYSRAPLLGGFSNE